MKKLLQGLIIFFLFQDLLFNNFYYFTYLDELLLIVLPIITVLSIYKNNFKLKLYKSEILGLISLIIIVIIGIISTKLNGYIDMKMAIYSMITTLKGYLIYYCLRIVSKDIKIDNNILKNISLILKYTIYTLSILLIINIPLNFLKSYGIRFGINSVAIGFSHPTELTFFCIIALTIILIYNYQNKIKRLNLVKILVLMLIVFAGRTKGLIFIAMFLGGNIIMNFTRTISAKKLILLIPIILIVSFPRIQSQFFGGDNGARGVLYRTAMHIANDNFPVGSGFGTFGSHVSRVNYSPIYSIYGVDSIWGLSRDNSTFITDAYWAMILGENGILGLVLVGILLYGIICPLLTAKYNSKIKYIIMVFIGYTLTSSIAEPIYTSNKSAILFICIALFNTLLSNGEFE